MFCEKCGQFNTDDSKFCANCRAELSPVAPTPEFSPAAPAFEAPAEPVFEAPAEPQVPTYEAPAEPVFETPVQQQAPTYEAPVQPQAPAYAYKIPAFLTTPIAKYNEFIDSRVKDPKLKKILAISIPIGAVLIILIVILLAVSLLGGSSAKSTFNKYWSSLAKGDGKALYNICVDPYELAECRDLDDRLELLEDYKDEARDSREHFIDEFGRNAKVKVVEYNSITKFDKRDIKDLNEYLSDQSDDFKRGDLQDICVIKAKVRAKGAYDDETETIEAVLYKVKGKWYYRDNSVCGVYGLYDKDDIKSAIKSVD